jgi:hypothetical protein
MERRPLEKRWHNLHWYKGTFCTSLIYIFPRHFEFAYDTNNEIHARPTPDLARECLSATHRAQRPKRYDVALDW